MSDLQQRLAALTPAKQRLLARRHPLSFAQERLWLLDRLHDGSAFYNGVGAIGLWGALDQAALATSLEAIVKRHQVLRTTFPVIGGEPMQLVEPPRPLALPVVDLAVVAAERRLETALDLAARTARRSFALDRGGLLIAVLARLDAARHVLFLVAHHIVCDNLSFAVLGRELLRLYAALATGEPAPLAELPAQYLDFARWQRQRLAAGRREELLAFWKAELDGAPRQLALPTDRPRPAVESFRGGVERRALPASLRRELRALATRQRASELMVFLAAFGALLARYSGQRELLLGTPVDHRRRLEFEGLIGLFVDTVVLRLCVASRAAATELVAEARRRVLAALEHGDLPFEALVEELVKERDLSRNPLFQVMLTVKSAEPAAVAALPGLEVETLAVREERAMFDLTLAIEGLPDATWAVLGYNRDLFDATTARRLLGHLETLLTALVAAPSRRLGELPLWSPGERQQVLIELGDTAAAPSALLPEGLVARARTVPERIAVVGGEEALSYSELARRGGGVAGVLVDAGVGPEEVVGVCLERSPSLLVGLWGLLNAGGAYLPLDPGLPEERLRFMLEDAGVRRVLCEEALMDLPALGDVERLSSPPNPLSMAGEGEQEVFVAGEGGQEAGSRLAYVIYTSGSTGRPKGVEISHGAFANFLAAMGEKPGLSSADRLLALTTLSFDIAGLELFLPLVRGATVILATRREAADAVVLARLLAAERANVLQATPATWWALMTAGWRPTVPFKALCGGEALPADLAVKILAVAGELWNLYGPTETTVWSSRERIDGDRPTIGRPIRDTRVHIATPELTAQPLGIVGELWIGGGGLARGYRRRPALTAERFVPDPWSTVPGARLYRTGDLARLLSDGRLDCLGRVDSQVKVRGFRVELGEIEAALTALPGVAGAAVVTRQQAAGDLRLIAFLTLEEGALVERDWRALLQRRLPEYMVPSRFVEVAGLPLTASGKVDRRALASIELAPSGGEARGAMPATPVEEILADLWGQLLGIETVGRDADFFALGGHSLLATRLLARLREMLGVEVPLRRLFERPTVAGFAAAIDEARNARPAPWPSLVPVPASAAMPLSFAQQRLWFLEQLEPGTAAYNLPGALRLRGALDRDALARSLHEIARRHAILRMRFVTVDGEPRQVVEPAGEASLPVVDLSALPSKERGSVLAGLLEAAARRPFELARGPLWRAFLVRSTATEHVLSLTLHHIVSDAWSHGVLARELGTLYAAFVEGAPSPLTALPVQYADYAVWQRGWLTGAVLDDELRFWRRRLADASPLELPTDRPRTRRRDGRGGSVATRWSVELTAGLRALARAHVTTLFMAVLAGLTAFLGRLAGQRAVSLGTPIAGRRLAVLEDLIGFFANTLVLRTELGPRSTFGELLALAREVCLDAFAHQDVPFEQLAAELQGERDLSRTALFQTFLALQNVPQEALQLPGLELEPVSVTTGTAKFELSLLLAEDGEEIAGILHYDRRLFDRSTVERWSRQLVAGLERAVAEPGLRLDELAWSTAAERFQLLVEQNVRPPVTAARTLSELFASSVLEAPDAVAVVCGGEACTFAALDARAERLAARLGVGLEERVGICVERSLGMIVAVLAVLKAGGAYVPLDPDAPEDRLAFQLADSGARSVLSQRRVIAERRDLDFPGVLVIDEDVDEPATLSARALPSSLAYVIYTSGSTGRPKGVGVEHRQVVSYTSALLHRLELGAVRSSFATVSTLAADLGNTSIFAVLASGGMLHVLDREAISDPQVFAEVMVRGRVDVLKIVPSHLEALLSGIGSVDEQGLSSPPNPLSMAGEGEQDLLPPPSPAMERGGGGVRTSPAGLPRRRLILGGEPCSETLLSTLRERCPQNDEPWLLNHYGPTETTIGVATCRPTPQDPTLPLGRPLDGNRLHVVDRQLRPAIYGAVGELAIAGPQLARGYLGRGALTAERFVPDPWSDGERLYLSGDLVRRLADGRLVFVGRRDQQVKVRGFRVELGEIENALRRLDGLRQAAVILSERPGEPARLVAFVVADAAMQPDDETLRSALAARLPAVMVPSMFVFLDELPLNANGKLDRRALVVPESTPSTATERELGAVEELMATIWASVLGCDAVGPEADFFALGGHSLLAAQLISRVRDAFDVDLPLRALFEEPTLTGLSAAVKAVRSGGSRPITPQDAEIAPLSFAQRRMFFLHRLGENPAAFNLPAAVRLIGELDVAAWRAALAEILRRHQVLRSTFELKDGEPRQLRRSFAGLALPIVDLSGLDADRRQREAERLFGAEARRPFDLAKDVLLRAALLRLAAREHVALLTFHHLASDAWSRRVVLMRELARLYGTFKERRPSPLAEPRLQYSDFAAWQRRTLQGEVLAEHVAFFRRYLDGARPTELPGDRPRPAVQRSRGARLAFTVPAERAAELRRLARQHQVTPFLTILAVFKVLLRHETKRDDIVVGTNLAGRDRSELEGLIGLFIQQLVLRTELAGDPTFGELLGRVRRSFLDAAAHQDLPFEKLVEELAPRRDASRHPLFQIKLEMQNAVGAPPGLPGLELEILDHDPGVVRYDLHLSLVEMASGELVGSLLYDTALYEAATARRLARRFELLLAAVLATPSARLSELDAGLATADEEVRAERRQEKKKSNLARLVKARRRSVDAVRELATGVER